MKEKTTTDWLWDTERLLIRIMKRGFLIGTGQTANEALEAWRELQRIWDARAR